MTGTGQIQEPLNGAEIVGLRRRRWTGDLTFRFFLGAITLLVTIVLGAMMVQSFITASPVYQKFGIIGFITGTVWAPSFTVYGAWAFIYGTVLTSIIALVLAVPIAVLIALLLTELAPSRLRGPMGIAVDLLAAVPRSSMDSGDSWFSSLSCVLWNRRLRERSARLSHSLAHQLRARATLPPASSWPS